MFRFIIVVSLAFVFSGCVKDKPSPLPEQTVTVLQQQAVYVICEGNFGSNNAALSSWDNTTQQCTEDLYSLVNSESCGDVLQSVSAYQNKRYLVVNNSAKIVVCDANFKKQAEIRQLNSPRYIQFVTPAKAYVSDLKSNAIQIINLNTNSVVGQIPCSGWTERMVMIYNKVFVCNINREYLYVINTGTDRLEDSIKIAANANSLVIDNEAMLWVLCRSQATGAAAQLFRIDPVSNALKQTLSLPEDASDLCANPDATQLYFISQGIKRLNIGNGSISSVANSSGNFYGLGVHPRTGDLYLSDAKDYTQQSFIRVFNSGGQQLYEFRAGINANSFYFD